MGKPRPGDTIVITGEPGGEFVGKEFVVVPCPGDNTDLDSDDAIWVCYEDHPYRVPIRRLEIVETTQDTKRDACGEGVDAFLKRQMDDNLRSQFV